MPNQILLIALAVIFAIALALTIAIICISSIQKEAAVTNDPVYPPEWTYPYISNEPIQTTLPLPAETDFPTTEDLGNGLYFESNRNGTCTLVGIGSCADAFITIPEYAPSGELVTAIASKALMGNSFVSAIQIPSGVTTIGTLAFANCPNLIYISVSRDNPAY